jgi:ketosteroid isomerase-like protein
LHPQLEPTLMNPATAAPGATSFSGPILGSAEEFVRKFQAFWSNPDPTQLGAVLTDDVRLIQPLSRTTFGLQAAQKSFAALFAQFPDLRATVDRWSGDDQVVFIEFHLHGSLGGRPIEWSAVDRFSLREGRAYERVSYFDGIPVALQLLRRPLAALRALFR